MILSEELKQIPFKDYVWFTASLHAWVMDIFYS